MFFAFVVSIFFSRVSDATVRDEKHTKTNKTKTYENKKQETKQTLKKQKLKGITFKKKSHSHGCCFFLFSQSTDSFSIIYRPGRFLSYISIKTKNTYDLFYNNFIIIL